MSDEEDTKQCPNCKREILPNNYTIHYVHCQRNFYLCTECGQPVNYAKRVEHDNTNHVTVRCYSCDLELEKYQLDYHLNNECAYRNIECKFCGISVEAILFEEHEDYCRSRTEKCLECGQFVPLKFKSMHFVNKHCFIKLSDEPGSSPSCQYSRKLCNFIPDLSLKNCEPASMHKNKSKECLKRSMKSASNESKDDLDKVIKKNLNFFFEDQKDDQITSKRVDNYKANVRKIARKEVDEWPVLSGLRSLQISDEKQDNSVEHNEVDEDSSLVYAIQVSQEINSDIWTKEDKDRANLKPLIENKLLAGKSVDKNMFQKETKKVIEQPESDVCRSNFNYFYDKHESVKLPCEFCGNLIVSNDLILHQSRCSLYMTDSYSKRNSAYKMPYFDENINKKIACGACNKFFRLSLLENHQLHCQRNSTKSSKNLKAVNMKFKSGLQNGFKPSSQFTRLRTKSDWLSELSKSNEEEQIARNNLNNPESGNIRRVSKKSRRVSSPPRR